jgi:hypothetical protein
MAVLDIVGGICPRSMWTRTMSSRTDLGTISLDVKTLEYLYIPFIECFPFMLHLRWAGQKSVLKGRAGIGQQCMSVTRFETGSARQLRHAFEQIRGLEEKVEGWDSVCYEVLDAISVAVPLGYATSRLWCILCEDK